MKKLLPPLMDLVELKKDVLDRDAATALPCNLSDFWLGQVADSLEQVMDYPNSVSERYLPGPIALVLHLLYRCTTSACLEVSYEQLYEYLERYRIEVTLETINRHTNMRTTSASLDTIFTDRRLTSICVKTDE